MENAYLLCAVSWLALLTGCAAGRPYPETIRVIEIHKSDPAPVPRLAVQGVLRLTDILCLVWHPSLEKARTIFGVVKLEQQMIFVPLTTDQRHYEMTLQQLKLRGVPADGELGSDGWIRWCPGDDHPTPQGWDTRMY